jgi:hypothetical protein
METNFKITIPKPCHEDWNAMTPDATGRFCSSCTKSVVDFTNKSTTEIQQYFIENQGKKVCGRFQNKQLDTIIITIPKYVLFSQVKFHKAFMLALLVSMGTTLFSCQDKEGSVQKIDKVEVVDSLKKQPNRQLLGDVSPTPDNTVPPPPMPKNETVYVRPTATSGIVSVEPVKEERVKESITLGEPAIQEPDSLPKKN